MRMRIVGLVALAAALLLSTPAFAGYVYNVDVYVDKSKVNFPDQQPFVDASVGRTYVPLRFVSQALGGIVTWRQDDETAVVYKDDTWIYMPIGSRDVTLDSVPEGAKTVTLDAPALLVGDRTMVPLRFVSECLGNSVTWTGPEKNAGRGRVDVAKAEGTQPDTGGSPGVGDAKSIDDFVARWNAYRPDKPVARGFCERYLADHPGDFQGMWNYLVETVDVGHEAEGIIDQGEQVIP